MESTRISISERKGDVRPLTHELPDHDLEEKKFRERVAERKRKANTPLKQQTLWAWELLYPPEWVLPGAMVAGIYLLVIGSVVLQEANSLVEVSQRYDESCAADGRTCTLILGISDDMVPPLEFRYGISGIYQNHRRYVKSVDEAQLSNDAEELEGGMWDCDPLEEYAYNTSTAKKLYPCGLAANAFFNDTFSAHYCDTAGSCVTLAGNNWQRTGISWKTDRDKRFITRPLAADETRVGPGGYTLPNVGDEDFIVWMRSAGLPSYTKLYAKLDGEATLRRGGTLYVNVTSNYPVSSFSGEKRVMVSARPSSWLGAKTTFLGVVHIVLGAIIVAAGLALAAFELANRGRLGPAKVEAHLKRLLDVVNGGEISDGTAGKMNGAISFDL